jgi:[ribosomal protein S18]-alanine N-acetyltransferase
MISPIRRARLEDLPAIAGLHGECFAESWDVEFLGRLLAQPGAFSTIAFELGLPAGFLLARVNAGEAEILSLGVRQSSRRRSVGTALVENALERAASAGASEVFLEVAVENLAARSLYGRLGFGEVGRRPAYYGQGLGPPADALVLRRPLRD